MVKCSQCGATVAEGKFCEKCGKPLVPASEDQVFETQPQDKAGGFFDKINSSMNKAATDLMAIKSDFRDGNLIYKVAKIPNVQEKKIKIEDTEFVYFNKGNGFEKLTDTFTTNDTTFTCYFLRNLTTITNNFSIPFDTLIKKLNDTDKLKITVNFNLTLNVSDNDKFFYEFTNKKPDTWKMIDINSVLSDEIRKIITDNTLLMLKKDGNLDLRDTKAQIIKFTDSTESLINNYVATFGLKVDSLTLMSVDTNINEINTLLIKNLYKEG